MIETKLFGCRLINFDLTHWFSTREAAERYGQLSGFEYCVVEKIDEV